MSRQGGPPPEQESTFAEVEEVFLGALERPAGERATYLDQRCTGNAWLRAEVEQLLKAEEASAGYFEDLGGELAASAMDEVERTVAPRITVGPYRAVEVLGRGGMGVVYRADRIDGQFEQQVALKLLHLDLTSQQMQARFAAERQLLARLEHPNIARLLDGGVTDEGRPYFVMECVDGVALDRFVADRCLGLRATVELFLQVVDAVAFLHRNLVVHRDLKPSNILVTSGGVSKLLDFGIAKAIGGDDAGVTRTGEQLLTPAYAAPEQLLGEGLTTSTDVYALGCILHLLLTGVSAHDEGGASAGIRDPRAVPRTVSGVLRRGRSSGKLTRPWRRVGRDLEAICSRALRPEPTLRYSSAEQMARDLRAYLVGRPVEARSGSRWYRVSRFARGNWQAVTVGLMLFALMGVGLLRERGLRNAAGAARDQAGREADKANAVSEFLSQLLSAADPDVAQGRDLTVIEMIEQALVELDQDDPLRETPEVEARVRRTLGETLHALGRSDAALPQLERALELAGGEQSDSPEAVAAVAALGTVLSYTGPHERAEALLRRVLDVRSEQLPASHPDVLRALDGLASILWVQARFSEVEEIDRRVLDQRRQTLGPKHPDTLRSMNSVGTTLFQQGRLGDAAELYREAWPLHLEVHGDSHPATLRIGNNLAASLQGIGFYSEAAEMLDRILAARRRVLGNEHRETATTLQSIGATLLDLGRLDAAERALQEAITIRSGGPVRNGSGVLSARSLWAEARGVGGDETVAERVLEQTLREEIELHGPESQAAARTRRALVRLLIRRARGSDLDRAARLLEAGGWSPLEMDAGDASSSSADLEADVLAIVAWLEVRSGRASNSLGYSAAAIEALLEDAAPLHRIRLEALEAQACAERQLGRQERSRELADDVERRRRELHGEGHLEVERWRSEFARSCRVDAVG